MNHLHADTTEAKGWYAGPWDSSVPVALGYANEGIDIAHHHETMFEIYLVAQGESVAIVDGIRVSLKARDVLVVEPGEVHTFVESTDDYFHFVVQTPFVPGDKVVKEMGIREWAEENGELN
ncbi:MAG: cupin domain-containing protein [Chloroflexota bacterium]